MCPRSIKLYQLWLPMRSWILNGLCYATNAKICRKNVSVSSSLIRSFNFSSKLAKNMNSLSGYTIEYCAIHIVFVFSSEQGIWQIFAQEVQT